jgi:hypothetical protein
MESRILKPILAVYLVAFILFLYGPFFVLGILSFQQGPDGGPQFPIIGVGGIASAADALEKRAAGADLVQIYTGLIYQGPALVTQVAKALKNSG